MSPNGGNLRGCHALLAQISPRTVAPPWPCPIASLHLFKLLVELLVTVGEAATDLMKSCMENRQRIQGPLCFPIQGPNFVLRLRLALKSPAQAALFAVEDLSEAPRDPRARCCTLFFQWSSLQQGPSFSFRTLGSLRHLFSKLPPPTTGSFP